MKGEALTCPCWSRALLVSLSLRKDTACFIQWLPGAGESGWRYVLYGGWGSAFPATSHLSLFHCSGRKSLLKMFWKGCQVMWLSEGWLSRTRFSGSNRRTGVGGGGCWGVSLGKDPPEGPVKTGRVWGSLKWCVWVGECNQQWEVSGHRNATTVPTLRSFVFDLNSPSLLISWLSIFSATMVQSGTMELKLWLLWCDCSVKPPQHQSWEFTASIILLYLLGCPKTKIWVSPCIWSHLQAPCPPVRCTLRRAQDQRCWSCNVGTSACNKHRSVQRCKCQSITFSDSDCKLVIKLANQQIAIKA